MDFSAEKKDKNISPDLDNNISIEKKKDWEISEIFSDFSSQLWNLKKYVIDEFNHKEGKKNLSDWVERFDQKWMTDKKLVALEEKVSSVVHLKFEHKKSELMSMDKELSEIMQEKNIELVSSHDDPLTSIHKKKNVVSSQFNLTSAVADKAGSDNLLANQWREIWYTNVADFTNFVVTEGWIFGKLASLLS